MIVDDSFSAYNDGYTQPHGSSGDDFQQAFQNLVLENFTSSADQMPHTFPLHHVADEIIQLPTNQASSPANTTTGVSTPTKNILGNLPLGKLLQFFPLFYQKKISSILTKQLFFVVFWSFGFFIIFKYKSLILSLSFFLFI